MYKLRTVPTFVTVQLSPAHLEICGFPVDGAHKYRDIFVQFKSTLYVENAELLASALGIQKENCG